GQRRPEIGGAVARGAQPQLLLQLLRVTLARLAPQRAPRHPLRTARVFGQLAKLVEVGDDTLRRCGQEFAHGAGKKRRNRPRGQADTSTAESSGSTAARFRGGRWCS